MLHYSIIISTSMNSEYQILSMGVGVGVGMGMFSIGMVWYIIA